jgi:hypothetical protein
MKYIIRMKLMLMTRSRGTAFESATLFFASFIASLVMLWVGAPARLWTQRHARLWMPLTSSRPPPRKRRVPEPGRLRPRVWGERRRAPAILKLGTEPSKEAKGWFRSALEPPSIGWFRQQSTLKLLKTAFGPSDNAGRRG